MPHLVFAYGCGHGFIFICSLEAFTFLLFPPYPPPQHTQTYHFKILQKRLISCRSYAYFVKTQLREDQILGIQAFFPKSEPNDTIYRFLSANYWVTNRFFIALSSYFRKILSPTMVSLSSFIRTEPAKLRIQIIAVRGS